jgi:AraC-like DNA-binding protein
MLYVDRVPSPPLDRFIATIWFCQSEPRPFALERVLPNGATQLIVNLKEDRTRMYHPESGAMTDGSGTVLSGISTRYGVIDTAEQECVAGICFRPGGTAPFFRVPAPLLRDTGVPLECLWDRRRAARLREQVLAAVSPAEKLDALERAMAEAWTASAGDPAVDFALDAFAHRPQAANIAAVADSIGLSPKRLVERFKTAVGFAPKRYCRILRFQRALKCVEARPAGGLDTNRSGLRVFRSGALRPRLPLVRRNHADRIRHRAHRNSAITSIFYKRSPLCK